MNKRQDNAPKLNQPGDDTLSALEVISKYTEALINADAEKMNSLRSPGFVLDWVYGDAFENSPRSAQETHEFWPSWFAGFPEMDYDVTRTIAAEEVVVVQWTFAGTNSGPLNPPVFRETVEATGKTIQLRGVSIYDVSAGLIVRETTYIDLATLLVELGITL